MTSTFFAILLNDASKLLRPSPVTVLPTELTPASPSPSYASHPNSQTLLALSDLSSLFSATPSIHHDSSKPRPKPYQPNAHITHKLTFYAARIISTPTDVLRMLADELMLRVELVRREGAQGEQKNTEGRMIELSDAEKMDVGQPKLGPELHQRRRVTIEELT